MPRVSAFKRLGDARMIRFGEFFSGASDAALEHCCCADEENVDCIISLLPAVGIDSERGNALKIFESGLVDSAQH